ncbi:MAG: hypothetical protein IPM64_03670 [Phycisphaerales bacterium]|nr:hypothetical protein [Phycisphaerales bacterium]
MRLRLTEIDRGRMLEEREDPSAPGGRHARGQSATRDGRTIRVWRVLAIRAEIRRGAYPQAQIEREAMDRLIDRILAPGDSSERERRAAR